MSEGKGRSRANSDSEHKENSSMADMSGIHDPVASSTMGSTLKESMTEFKQNPKCSVCNKKFSITARRHHCRFCGDSVCDLHSLKRRPKPGDSEKQRICDNCDKEFIREEVRKEVEEEVSKLEKQVQYAKEVNEKLYKEHYEKTAKVNQLELELTKAERVQKQKEQALQEKLIEEQKKGTLARHQVDELGKALDNSRKSEKEMIEKCSGTEKQLETLKSQTETLRERRTELEGQIEHLTSRLKGSLPLDQVREIMCQRCRNRLNQTYKPLVHDGTIPEEGEDESSFLEKE